MATPRLKEKYKSEIVAKLEKDLNIANINQVPKVTKIVVNMGVGAAAADSKILDGAIADMRVKRRPEDLVGIPDQIVPKPDIDRDQIECLDLRSDLNIY